MPARLTETRAEFTGRSIRPLTDQSGTLSLFNWRKDAWRRACLEAASRWLKARQVSLMMKALKLAD